MDNYKDLTFVCPWHGAELEEREGVIAGTVSLQCPECVEKLSKFDRMPEHLKDKWFKAAQEQYSKKPVGACRLYELEALRWYWSLMQMGFDYEPPQSYNEALLWHQYQHQAAQVNLEIAKRYATSAEEGLKDWEAKRK